MRREAAHPGRIIVISDRVEHLADIPDGWSADEPTVDDRSAAVVVEGGYLERLPLSLIAAGRFAEVEVWHHGNGLDRPIARRCSPHLVRRVFPLGEHTAPFDNRAMAEHLARHGAPALLLIYGLGVSPVVLDAADRSIIVYNSIDAPALRVPEEVSARCDIVLTGAQWQSDEVNRRHPEMPTPILPVGPEFAGTDQFRPLSGEKDYDLIYAAAAQPYKRHDILFDTVERLDGAVSALCVFGYGELAEAFRDEIAARQLPIDCVMPPVVPFAEVNRLMNRARIGIVAGVDDGAPAIITEYMLAGLPVLANAQLTCGLQYLLPGTGEVADPAQWPAAVTRMLQQLDHYRPREIALSRWSWPVSAARFLSIYDDAVAARHALGRAPITLEDCDA